MDRQLRSLERQTKAGKKTKVAEAVGALLAGKVRAGQASEFERNQLELLKRIEEQFEDLRKRREEVLLHTEKKCKRGRHILRTTVTGYKGHVIDHCELCDHFSEGYDD